MDKQPTHRSEGAHFDHPRTYGPPPEDGVGGCQLDRGTAPPVWDGPAYPGEYRWVRWAARHPRAVKVLAAAGAFALWVAFIYEASR